MVLSTGDLERMRNGAEALLPVTCTIQTATLTGDAFGGTAKSWANTYTAVACRLMPITRAPRPVVVGDQTQGEADWIVSLHHDQAIALGNRITTSNRTLEPLEINVDQSHKVSTRVWCRELRTG